MHRFALAVFAVVISVPMGAKAAIAFLDGARNASTGEVAAQPRLLGIHHLSLREGVDAEEFERFIAEEWAPVAGGLFPGIELMVMKGERNAAEGDYVLIYDIQSVYVRDWYFPTPGEGSEAANAIGEACGDSCTTVWEAFDELAEITEWADWVEVSGD